MNNAIVDKAHTYTDFSGLNALKAQARTDKSAALKEVSKQFESMFVSMMMKGMRAANKPFEEGNFLHSSESDFYRDMFDSQLSLSMTKGKGMGLAEALYRQLSQQTGVESMSDVKSGKAMSIADYPRNIAPTVIKFAEAVEQVDQLMPKPTEDQPGNEGSTKTASYAMAFAADSNESVSSSALQRDEPQSFSSAQEFVDYLYPAAKNVEDETGIDARFLLAQSALETGWGKHMIRQSDDQHSYNLFGIKADSRWEGDSVDITTTEYREGVAMKEKAAFRSYGSYEESFRDYVDFIQSNDRYSEALDVMEDPKKFVEELQKAGYATDPKYSEKVNRIFNSDLLQSALTLNQG